MGPTRSSIICFNLTLFLILLEVAHMGSESNALEPFSFQPLTDENLEAVYELFKRNEQFFLIPLEFFRRGTLNDEGYDPDLSIVLSNPQTNEPIAAIVAVIKKGWVRTNCYLKACIVDEKFRRQGIGSKILKEIMQRAKSKLRWRAQIRWGDCPPRYWQPGVDVCHTSLVFFLKNHGFKTHGTRQNLTVPLSTKIPTPKSEIKGYSLERVKPEDFEATVQFVKANFRFGTWAEEAKISFENDPPTTFIAKDRNGSIAGFATHSNQFLGSFGPTGVNKALRGKGIGGELLRWCICDMQQMELDVCTILWVVGNTIKFYSKVLGAYIHPVFYPMGRRL